MHRFDDVVTAQLARSESLSHTATPSSGDFRVNPVALMIRGNP